MKKTLISAAATMAMSASAFAAPMYIDVGTNVYDLGRLNPALADVDTRTGNFNLFGFTDIFATSIYDFSDGSVLGAFYDTNIASELAAAGVPTSGTALDTITPVSLVSPNCGLGQCDIDALSPLVPPLASNNEGFLQSWDLQVEYHFDGVLTAAGPVYTGGTFSVFFNDLNDDTNDKKVLEGNLTGSSINLANLNLFFEITFADPGFLWVDDGSGVFRDASTMQTFLTLDTNVDPPVPTADQLLLVVDDTGNPNAIRQSSLDESITAKIPEPASLALLGIGLAGLGFSRRRV